MTSKRNAGQPATQRPEIFGYHDHLEYLRDWLAFKKASQSDFSLRTLAKQAGLAAGYLPMVLGGKRPLTGKALARLLPYLGLDASEQSFLEHLLVFGTSESQEARFAAHERMKRFGDYRKQNRPETEVSEYLTHWYYVAIREMAALADFEADPLWIQRRLRFPVGLKEIKEALAFLLESGFLEKAADGSVRPPAKALDCTMRVFGVSLTKFHREALELAGKAIENTPAEQRNVQGHTFAIREENYAKANAIVENAIRQLVELTEAETRGDSIYHLEVALFPLTREEKPK
jgi:uncharacterized protein (TIGR02147 family)